MKMKGDAPPKNDEFPQSLLLTGGNRAGLGGVVRGVVVVVMPRSKACPVHLVISNRSIKYRYEFLLQSGCDEWMKWCLQNASNRGHADPLPTIWWI